MDRRLKTTFIGVTAVALSMLLSPMVSAQQATQYPDYRDDEAPQVERNQELPKGLTLVPWKIEQRTSLREIQNGDAPRPGSAQQSPPGQSR